MPHNVIVYSTPTCPYCEILKAFLRDNNVPYEYIDLTVQPGKIQEMVLKSGQLGVPVIDVDGNIVVGFDRQKLKELLGITDQGTTGQDQKSSS